MNIGIYFCILGAISFGLLGAMSKLAERKQCNASSLVVWVFGWAALIMLVRWFALPTKAHVTWGIAGIAVIFGICAAVAYLAFQLSIGIGNVTVGWLSMNLSAGVPAIVSIWLYSEKLTMLKIVAFSLALISLACLFEGNRLEAAKAQVAGKAAHE